MGVNDGNLRAWALSVGTGSQWPMYPALLPGIHLRWELNRQFGLPWGGFYLLSRPCELEDSPALEGIETSAFPWDTVGGVSMPIALPVIDPDYPASGAIPLLSDNTTLASALNYGLARVSGPMKGALHGGFFDLHALLVELVKGGPNAGDMTVREQDLKAAVDGDPNGPRLATQSVLDLALLGAAFPEYAQLLGIYAIDTGADWVKSMDYLVVADCRTAFKCDIAKVVDWANAGMPEIAGVQARIVANVATKESGKLPPPRAVAAYQMPISSLPVQDKPNEVQPWFGAAGLVWDCLESPGVFGDVPLRSNLFKVRRASLPPPVQQPVDLATASVDWSGAAWAPSGDGESWHLANGERSFQPIDAAVPGDWPPWAVQYLDPLPQEGWHTWKVQAMDWFGRQSLPSAPAQWRHWTLPTPDGTPLGGLAKFLAMWTGLGDNLVHPQGMLVLDKTPPPAPSNLEVDVADVDDPWHLGKAWLEANAKLVGTSTFGARVRWSWPRTAERQAPDLAEFRVYLRLGASGIWRGNVKTAWTSPNDVKGIHGFSLTMADPGLPSAAGLVGGTLRVGDTAATIEYAQVGPAAPVGEQLVTVHVNLPPPHQTDAVAPGEPCTLVSPGKQPDAAAVSQAPWQRQLVVTKAEGTGVFEVFRDDDGQPYELPVVEVTADALRVGFETPLNAVFPGLWQVIAVGTLPDSSLDWANKQLFEVVKVDLDERLIYTDPAPTKLAWVKGWMRAYLGQATTTYECYLPLDKLVPEPPQNQPKAWFEIAVSAADSRLHTADWCVLTAPLGGRPGNESQVAGPLRGERIRRSPPAKVEAMWEKGPLYASPADVDGRSYFTVRWKAGPEAVRVYRASAEAVFRADWEAGGLGLTGEPLAKLLEAFPGLKAPGLAVKGGVKSFAPIAAAYGELTDEKQQTVASGEHVAEVFAPVTAGVLAKGATPDVVGPDAAPGYLPQSGVGAFVDTLDGLVAGGWFYRVGAVDGAGAETLGGGASPGVALRCVETPPAPRVLACHLAGPVGASEFSSAQALEATFLSANTGAAVVLQWVVTEAATSWAVQIRAPGQDMATIHVKPKLKDGVAEWLDPNPSTGVTAYRVLAISKSGSYSLPSDWRGVKVVHNETKT